MTSDDEATQGSIEEFVKAALAQHRADPEPQWQAVASNYAEAMMGAQLMERAAAVVVVATNITQMDKTDSQSMHERFERAFTEVTAGYFKNESPIVDDPALSQELDAAWKVRNKLAHRFFLDNLTSLFSPSACEALVADLEDSSAAFTSTSHGLMTLAFTMAEQRGVDPKALHLFGMLSQMALADSPRLFDGLNPWLKNDGEAFVIGVAEFFGIDINEQMAADTDWPVPCSTEEAEPS